MFDWFNNTSRKADKTGKSRQKADASMDIDGILQSWPAGDKAVTARMITGNDSKLQLQLRLDCGIMQMYMDGRPDGENPHKCPTLLEYMEQQLAEDPDFDATSKRAERDWNELDREMTQFYHRRVALLSIARKAQKNKDAKLATQCYRQAARDAEYTLQAMDFIRDFSEDEESIEVHERFRPFVLWHWTVAMTEQKILDEDFDLAIEQVKHGMGSIAKIYKDHGMSKWLEHDPSMVELKQLEKKIRKRYNIKATLQEQLQDAIKNEDYESAAKLRDKLKDKGRFDDKDLPMLPPTISNESF